MKDIVPGLLKSVLSDFHTRVEKDTTMQGIISGKDKKTTLEEVSRLAEKVGEYAYLSLKENLTKKNLPDDTLYWNIAKRIIVPLIQEVQRICLDMAEAAQKRQDKKIGIGIKPIRPPFNEERIEAVLNRIVFISQMPEVPDIEQ